ncbi:DUF1934 domain-containing protein [Halothermothrix orenii]|uniref:Uncharacterized protein conserved in bacteria n=1 Tax=Halothermothrix orenii (strain H 168 / OCM 544 / DSM 9562) TaxID=373903 RepID=B8CZ38_HALOH|nr:DUF1934 domain-containing protein [Halothermothrix orenii]ACL70557.1 uncharacterized protein conserved in bacteria [Halothermothrix orenii H 168]
MGHPVNIRIKNKHTLVDGFQDKIEYEGQGNFYLKDDSYYLVYRDYSEGLDGARTTVKIKKSKDRVLIKRGRPAPAKQVFMSGQTLEGWLRIDNRQVAIKTKTEEINCSLNKSGGELHIEYELFIGGRYSGKYSLSIFLEISE